MSMIQFARMKDPDHWQYAGEALFFVWLAWRVMRWVWRTSKEVQEEPTEELGAALEAEQLKAKHAKRPDDK